MVIGGHRREKRFSSLLMALRKMLPAGSGCNSIKGMLRLRGVDLLAVYLMRELQLLRMARVFMITRMRQALSG